jgi:hypothetical protein
MRHLPLKGRKVRFGFRMKSYFSFLVVLVLFSAKAIGQILPVAPLSERLAYGNYVLLSVICDRERTQQIETFLVYREDVSIKIHAVVKDHRTMFDTTFILSSKQIATLDKIEKAARERKLASNDSAIVEGTYTYFEMVMDGRQKKFEIKGGYSILKELFSK